MQVIVVDDCSSDSVKRELKRLEEKFPHVMLVYLRRHSTAGHARNVGLEYANGDYIIFADADDFFHECINSVFDEYKDETCDMIVFNADSVEVKTGAPGDRHRKLQRMIEEHEHDSRKGELFLRYCFTQPWCRFVRRKLIEDGQIKFDEIFAINDTTFAYLIGFKADRIKVDRRKLYCITKRDDSLTFIPSLKRSLLVIDVLSRKNKFLKQHGIPVFDFEIFNPFRDYFKQGDWHSLGILFAKAKLCGYSKCFILFQMLGMSLRCRWSAFTGKEREILTQLVWPRLFSVSRK